ncbi:type 1 fimbrial protein [Salmonella enterica]|nr:type 1 fimbrial protein [Salmonella enterica subsp. enterica serovar Sandiego]ECJ6126394.1 type 1 fimbrial protein [Salmonella enterica]EHH3360974.1 type 1 fimbrial protein [Salmonella enterica subsp. enterica serovar Sandiego]EJE9658050.1 type 1 fimbrial protein [Salmonella enterica]EJE9776421.1 type 1 fimbrial protein [Salmonella enterica]
MNINIFLLVTLLTGGMLGNTSGVMAADRGSIPGGSGDVDINVSRVSRTCSVAVSGNNQNLGTVSLLLPDDLSSTSLKGVTVFELQGCQNMVLTLTMQAESTVATGNSPRARYQGLFPNYGSYDGNFYEVALSGDGISGGKTDGSFTHLVPLDGGPADPAIVIKPVVDNYQLKATTVFNLYVMDLLSVTPGTYRTWYTYNFTYV